MARNPVRHRGINTGLNRRSDRVYTPKRMLSDPFILATLTIPDAGFTKGAQADPADGWLVEDEHGGAVTLGGTYGAEIPRWSRIRTTVTGLEADSHYRVTLTSSAASFSSDYWLAGRQAYTLASNGDSETLWFHTPSALIATDLVIGSPLGAMEIGRDIKIDKYDDVFTIDDADLNRGIARVGSSTPEPTWTTEANGTGAYAGLPTVTGGTMTFASGNPVPNQTMGLRTDQIAAYDVIGSGQKIVGNAPYKLKFGAATVLSDPATRWELGNSLTLGDFESGLDETSLSTQSEIIGWAGGGASSDGNLAFDRKTTGTAGTVAITAPITFVRGAVPAPTFQAVTSIDGDDQGGTFNTTRGRAIGWGGTISQWGASWQINSGSATIASTDPIRRAILKVKLDVFTAAGTTVLPGITIRGHTDVTQPFSGTNLPGANTTASLSDFALSEGWLYVDVTTIVAELVLLFSDVTDYINIATGLTDADVDVELGVSANTEGAELMIISGNGVF